MQAVSNERWQDAQVSERKFWSHFGLFRFRRSIAGTLDTVIWARKRLNMPSGDWLEVGVGPLGVGCAHFLDCPGELHILDPIEVVAAADWDLPAPCKTLVGSCQQASIKHVGQAERLDFHDGAFTLVVMANMLDHVEDPGAVLREARRVLKSGGQLLLAVHTYSLLGEARYRVKARSQGQSDKTFYRAHAHRFSSRGIQELVESTGFHITHVQTATRTGAVLGRGMLTHLIAS